MVKIWAIWRINRTIVNSGTQIEPLYYCRKIYGADKKKSEQSLIDYKFFCFNGVPKYVVIYSDREENTHIIIRLWFMTWIGMPILNFRKFSLSDIEI